VNILESIDRIKQACADNDEVVLYAEVGELIRQGKRAMLMRILDISSADGTIEEYESLRAPLTGTDAIKRVLENLHGDEAPAVADGPIRFAALPLLS
jgi:hypothetical protein